MPVRETDQRDLDLLVEAAQSAGDIAARFFRADVKTWDKGDGQGPVTEADLAVNAHLQAIFEAKRPDYGWMSEESDPLNDTRRLGAEATLIIDPIDGTRAFIDGQLGFATAIAVVRAGQPVAAVVHLPIKDLTYSAVLGGGAFLNGAPITGTKCAQIKDADVLAAKPALDARHWAGGVPEFRRHFRPSLAWRLSLVAQGRFDAMLTLRKAWDWDIAGASLIAQEAGVVVTDPKGQRLIFNQPQGCNPGVVAAPPDLHRKLVARLTGPASKTEGRNV